MEIKIFIFILLLAFFAYIYFKQRKARQFKYIQSYRFHPKIANRVKEIYPHLSDADVKIVFDALRDYFHICNIAQKKMVAMPSQVVDVAWHEFILFTRNYKSFCDRAIGHFLHHTPTEAMKTPTLAQEGIKRAWRLSCTKEKIDPAKPLDLPLLFAIDGLLNIEDGYNYSLDCKNPASPMYGSGYCAGDIGCTSGCAGDSGASSHSSGGFFDSGNDTSGCSGSSCGGGGD